MSGVRAQRKKDAEDVALAKQIEHLAFNIRGHAMQDGMQNRQLHEVICAYPRTHLTYKAFIKKAATDGTKNVFKTGAAYSSRELGEVEIGVKQYLVVGYTLRNPPKGIEQIASEQSKQQAVGIQTPPTKNIISWDDDEPPVLVVAEIVTKQPEGIQLFALVLPRNGLCVPHPIANDIVFYRHEYRDGTTNVRKRGPNWNNLVARQCIRPGLTAPLSEKQLKFKRAKDPVSLAFNANISLGNEVAQLVANFKHTPDLYFMDEIKSIFKAIDNDLNYRKPLKNSGLRLFLEAEENLTEDQAQQFVEDFEAMWPRVQHVTADRVMKLQAELLDLDEDLEYGLIKPFISEACWKMENSSSEDFELGEMVEGLVGSLRRMFEPHEEAPPAPTRHRDALLSTVLAKLKEIVVAGTAIEEQMKSSLGDTAFDRSTYDVWGHFADASDTDTARAAFMQEVKVLTAAVRQKETGLKGMVEDMVAVLEKLDLDRA